MIKKYISIAARVVNVASLQTRRTIRRKRLFLFTHMIFLFFCNIFALSECLRRNTTSNMRHSWRNTSTKKMKRQLRVSLKSCLTFNVLNFVTLVSRASYLLSLKTWIFEPTIKILSKSLSFLKFLT